MTPEQEKHLLLELGQYQDDPHGFVHFAYPWKKQGSILEQETGPDEWQEEYLIGLGEAIEEQKEGKNQTAIRFATKSGHGVGKTAIVAWLIDWFTATHPNPQVVVTANTQTQLSTKTWRELSKWHHLGIHKDLLTWTATKYYMNMAPGTWYASAIPWSETNPDAFHGTHEKHILFIFDEASAIADVIWNVVEGGLTTVGAIWCVFGNPTRNTGKFRECWRDNQHRWKGRTIDSRKCKKVNIHQVEEWMEDYGEDGDFFRVKVRGEFPRADDLQFISDDIIDLCKKYKSEGHDELPLIIGLDVARYGSDKTVWASRQGRFLGEPIKRTNLSVTEVGDMTIGLIKEKDPSMVMIDEVGIGAGVVDYIETRGYGSRVVAVNGGRAPSDKNLYYNKRAEMYGRLRNYMKRGVQLPKDGEFVKQVTNIQYQYTAVQQIQLEKKEDMKRRGMDSPDVADAVALTFSEDLSMDWESEEVVRERYARRNRTDISWRVV